MPAADRRAERRARLLDAGLDLLGTEGLAATTVRGVCQRARLNPRYFYESFASLDDLAVAVYDRIVEQLTAEVRSALAASPPGRRARARAAVDCIVGFVDGDRRRARVLYVEAVGNATLSRRRAATGRTLVDWVVRDRTGPPSGGPHDPRAVLAAAVVVGGFNEALVAWLDGQIALSRERLVDDATALFLGVEDTVAGMAAAGAAKTQMTPAARARAHEGEGSR